jgi:RNA polymerase sporulation-specific sigma factor
MQRELLQLFKINCNDSLFKELQKEYGGLIVHYANRMYQKTKKYGEEFEDCIQQCWLCFLKAIQSYDMSSEYNFTAFLVSCLTNNMINYTRDFYRRQEKIKSVSYNNFTSDEDSLSYLEIFESEEKSPSEIYEINEAIDNFVDLECISLLEKQIFLEYLRGYSYKEISSKFKISKKKIDNVIRKIKVIIGNKKINI